MTNVLLVTIDSLRRDHVGCYGYERNTTPVIDDLAEGGLYFDAFANANWTRASFPSIITSTYPLEYGGFEYLADKRTTVGTAVGEAGHATGAFHSNLWLSRDYNYDRGFDRFYDSKSDPSILSRLRSWVKLNVDHDSLLYRTLQRLYDTTEEQAGLDVGQTYKDAAEITEEAIDWIAGVDGPFFCWVHYMDVHHPYLPHEEAAAALGLDLGLGERDAIKLRRKMLEDPDELSEEEFCTLLDLYDAEIRYTDDQIGRLLDTVDRSFDAEDTAVVVTSDHGEEFDDHGGFSHNPSMYDEVLSVPLVVSGAGAVSETASTGHQPELVELLDVAPTCVDLAGGEIPEGYRGRSLLEAATPGTDARLIAETDQADEYKLALRTREWKFIWDRDAGTRELYNLVDDPGEREEVSVAHPDIAADLERELADHLSDLRQTNEALPEPDMDVQTKQRLRDLGYLS
ncbi:MAG: sulfatase [Haloarculaceae archaeon]